MHVHSSKDQLQPQFQNTLGEAIADAEAFIEACNEYSDCSDLTEADLTQARAITNSIAALELLVRGINAHKT